jgi:hypothetical protein
VRRRDGPKIEDIAGQIAGCGLTQLHDGLFSTTRMADGVIVLGPGAQTVTRVEGDADCMAREYL